MKRELFRLINLGLVLTTLLAPFTTTVSADLAPEPAPLAPEGPAASLFPAWAQPLALSKAPVRSETRFSGKNLVSQPVASAAQGPKSASSPDDPLAKVEPSVMNELAADGKSDFFIWMTEKADLSPAYTLKTKEEKGRFVFEALRETAEHSQKELRTHLDEQGIGYHPFYIANKILIRDGSQTLLLNVASRSDVAWITANHKYQLEEPSTNPNPPAHILAVESNISFVNADDVWAMGHTGEGIVLAGNDTGLDWDHPALINQYRGWDGATADHNYNWWDATGRYPTAPSDGHGHGTHTSGTMVGDDGAGNQIGMAPGAQIIHCKNMSDWGGGDAATFTECFEWDLAPWDLNGQNPRPDLAPDAINNSWGNSGGGYPVFEDEIAALQAAGILVEVSAGNDGPSCGTLGSPGDYEQVLTTGSVNHTNGSLPGTLTGFSSRGPSSLYPAATIPDVVAPGENIRSSIPGGGYEGGWSGTSMSGPHVTGLIGLIWSANPGLRGMVTETVKIILDTAVPLTGQTGSGCGGDYTTGPNNDWGYGTIDALAAAEQAILYGGVGTLVGTVTDGLLLATVPDATIKATLSPTLSWQTTSDTLGDYSMTVFSGTYTVDAYKYGHIPARIAGVSVVSGTTTRLNITLPVAAHYIVSGFVTDSATGDGLWATINTAGDPVYPPTTTVRTDRVTGYYNLTLVEGITYTFDVAAPLHNNVMRTVGPLNGDTTENFALTATTTNGMIAGWVRNKYTSAPIANATVQVDGGPSATTDAEGYYETPALAPGFYTAKASANLHSSIAITNIEVPASNIGWAGFYLPAANIAVEPTALQQTLEMGTCVTNIAQLVISNTGEDDLDWEFFEAPGGFVPTSLDSGGPDPFGYTHKDSHEPGGPRFEWIEINTTGTDMRLGDDSYFYPIVLPFSFNFYGTDHNQVAVGSNGTAYFEDNYLGYRNVCPIPAPNPYGVHAFIAGYWDDLNPGAGGAVYYEIQGSRPRRKLIIEWDNVPIYGTSDLVKYEVILFEGTNNVLIQYERPSPWQGSGATVGIQGDTTTGLEYSCNTPALQDNLSICFQYPGSPPCGGGLVVPWIQEVPVSGTVTISASRPITIGWQTCIAEVAQPGTYYATLHVSSNAPANPLLALPVTMTVTAPTSYGKLTGVVSSTGYCDATPYPIEGGQVYLEGSSGYTFTLETDAAGTYQRWLGAAESPYTLTVSYPEHPTTTMSVAIVAGATTTQNLTLRWQQPCVSVGLADISATLDMGLSTTLPMNISNSGAAATTFELAEIDNSYVPASSLTTVLVPGYQTSALEAGKAASTYANPNRLLRESWSYQPSTDAFISNIPADVLLLAAADATQIQAMLQAYPDINLVDYFDARVATPTLAQLLAYDTTIVMANSPFADPAALGDMLADYVDAGGTVIQTVPTFYDPAGRGWGLQGRFINEGYSPFIGTGDWFLWADLGAFETSHPIMQGVTSAGDDLRQMVNLATGADLVAEWSDDECVATKGSVVALNTFLADDYNWMGDVALIVHNSITWLQAGNDVPWLFEDPITGTVPSDGGLAPIDVTLDTAYVARPGEYYATLNVNNDDPDNSLIGIPVTMTVNAPLTYGKLEGTVTSLGHCDTNTTTLEGAEVLIEGSPLILTTDASGSYAIWLDQSTYTVTVSAADHLADTTVVTVTAQTTTTQDSALRWLQPCVGAEPNRLAVTVDMGTSMTTPLTLTNSGALTATFQMVGADRGRQTLGPVGGGPDPFGYTYMDSNEPGGPAYNFVDISATGTPVPLGDDDFAGPFNMDFFFNFYGTDQARYYVGSNGFLSFGRGLTSYSNQCPLPNTSTPNNLIAMHWDDLDPDSGGTIYRQSVDPCPYGSGACEIIMFDHVPHFSGGPAGVFEVILFENGNMLFQFQDPGAELGSSATTGIENNAGTVGLTYATCDSAYLSAGLAVCFAYPGNAPDCLPGDVGWLAEDPITGKLAADSTSPITVTFDASVPEVTQPGEYYATLNVDSDDPVNNRFGIPITMTANAPPTYGKLEGTVCSLRHGDVNTTTLEGAEVLIAGFIGAGTTVTLTTGVNGGYSYWLDQGIYTVTVFIADYLADTAMVTVTAQTTTRQDFVLLLPASRFSETGQEAGVSEAWDAHAAAWGDYDADGDLDLYVAVVQGPNRLYHNDGDGTFTEVSAAAGVAHSGSARGVVFADIDNDGLLDLYVANEDGVAAVLYRNNGDGTFSDTTSSADNAYDGMAPLFADYDKDGHLDLYLTVWGCDVLYHNNGDGTFSNVTAASGVDNCQTSVGGAWADYDNDGDQDVYVANFWGAPNVLYRNNGDTTFTEVAATAGVDNANDGEGVAWGDYDNDGDLDLYLTNDWNQANVLYRNNGDTTFTDVTAQASVGDTGTGRNPLFADVDNDGDLDLYVVNAGQSNVLYRNNGDGTFTDMAWIWSGDDAGSGQGAATGDYDNDGYLDLYVVNMGTYNRLYHNNGGDNHWLVVKAVGITNNWDSIGARVTITCDGHTQVREVRAGTGWLSQDSLPVEFGLGAHTRVDRIEVRWPNGAVQAFTDVAADQFLTIDEINPIITRARLYLPLIMHTRYGGPDSFGYTYMDSNKPGGPAYNFVDISATGTPVPLGDDDF